MQSILQILFTKTIFLLHPRNNINKINIQKRMIFVTWFLISLYSNFFYCCTCMKHGCKNLYPRETRRIIVEKCLRAKRINWAAKYRDLSARKGWETRRAVPRIGTAAWESSRNFRRIRKKRERKRKREHPSFSFEVVRMREDDLKNGSNRFKTV